LTIGALFVLWVISRAVGPTIGDLFKIAVLFVALIAIAQDETERLLLEGLTGVIPPEPKRG